jgi:hypothetical protein
MACVAHTDAGCHLSELARLLAVSRRADGQDPSEMLVGGVRSELDTVVQNRTGVGCRMARSYSRPHCQASRNEFHASRRCAENDKEIISRLRKCQDFLQ